MPNNPFDATQIPASRVPISQGDTKEVSREWYRFLFNAFTLLGSGSNTTSLTDIQLAPPDVVTSQVPQNKYGAFYDTSTQTPAAINTAYPIVFGATDISNGVYIGGADNSRVYVTRTGAYNFQFSLQLSSKSAAAKLVYIWASVNGTAVPNSATKVTLQGSSAAYVAAWNFMLKLSANDYFQLMWSADSTDVDILSQAAASPAPAIPSVILTVTDNIGVK